MATHSLPSDSTARRLRSLEIQNYLIKIAVVVLMLLLLWRTFSGGPAPAPVEAPAAGTAEVTGAVEVASPDDMPQEKAAPSKHDALTAASVSTPGLATTAPAATTRIETNNSVSIAEPKAPAAYANPSPAQIYRTTQQLIEATYRDPRYRSRFDEAWSKRTHATPSGRFLFPETLLGQVVGPTQQTDGFRDYQVWGEGLVDAQAQRPSSVWYMVLWNFDPSTGRAYIESLSIGGKEIVHDWRPYSKERVGVEVE